jgi:hypothetical protein
MLGSGIPAAGTTAYLSEDEIKAEARRDFEALLDLWHDKKYDEVYERTIIGGKKTKEEFTARLAAASLRPACCWEKMQEVTVTVRGESSVTLRAKIGFAALGRTEFKTKAFRLIKEEGLWRMSQSDILSLAGTKKGKGVRSRKVRRSSMRMQVPVAVPFRYAS